METNKNPLFSKPYRKYDLQIDDKTNLLVKFTGIDDDSTFLYPRSLENYLEDISPYEVLRKVEENIRNDFFKNHELPEVICQGVDERGHTEAIFDLKGLYEHEHGHYEAVYCFFSFVS